MTYIHEDGQFVMCKVNIVYFFKDWKRNTNSPSNSSASICLLQIYDFTHPQNSARYLGTFTVARDKVERNIVNSLLIANLNACCFLSFGFQFMKVINLLSLSL